MRLNTIFNSATTPIIGRPSVSGRFDFNYVRPHKYRPAHSRHLSYKHISIPICSDHQHQPHRRPHTHTQTQTHTHTHHTHPPSREEPGTWCGWGGDERKAGLPMESATMVGDIGGLLRFTQSRLHAFMRVERGTLPTSPALRAPTERRTRTRRLSTWRQRRWLSRRSRFRTEVAAWSRKSRGSR